MVDGMQSLKEKWDSWEGLSASTLKMIALLSMLIDHVGAGILSRYLIQVGYREIISCSDPARYQAWMLEFGALYRTYRVLRGIGRMAFPIYSYFLVEGMKYTRNVSRYLCRLLLFAVISEVPFDLLFYNTPLEFSGQNVYFTLAIGLMVMIGIREVGLRIRQSAVSVCTQALILLAGCALAELLRTDYSYYGVLSITLMYFFSASKPLELLSGALSFCWGTEFPVAPLTFGLLGIYKKKRGIGLKYFFYAFYPAHLLLLYLLALCLGLG